MKKRNAAIPAVYAFFFQGNKVLLARRCNTSYQDGNYHVPSGHAEEGELPRQAMIREAREEVGVEIAPDDLEIVHVSYRPKHDPTGDRVDFFFKVKNWKGEITNMEPKKCDDLKWCDPHLLPPNMTPHVREALQSALKGEMFSERGINWLKANGEWNM